MTPKPTLTVWVCSSPGRRPQDHRQGVGAGLYTGVDPVGELTDSRRHREDSRGEESACRIPHVLSPCDPAGSQPDTQNLRSVVAGKHLAITGN